ncbi:Di-copper centre-containing protein [Auriculariales sp. MPI-PUGE-AT-0066]|nr:Di-copper centre-containing protein [Auriculariales sp. MPI-PUGE-AT-0066]
MAYVINGRKDSGETHVRREIRDLNENFPEQFALFILGWTGVQYPNAPLNFMPAGWKPGDVLPPGGDHFAIGSIHGIPYERWAGDPPFGMLSEKENEAEFLKALGKPPKIYEQSSQPDSGESIDDHGRKVPLPGNEAARYGGYCNHGSVLFPPWHRPYLMVLEQSICMVATAVAQEFARIAPAKGQKWIEAAKQLRFPFYDWTLEDAVDEGFPDVLESNMIRIRGPDGKSVSVPNPISSYRFDEHMNTERTRDFRDFEADVPYSGNPPQKTRAYFRKWNRTCRWPKDDPAPSDRLEKINYQLARLYNDLRSKVAHMFTYEEDANPDSWPYFWDEFSNTSVQSNPITVPNEPGARTTISKSLEAAHNSLHLIIGGAGHMGQNEFAGFDPIFYMHHCNVDRIYALWEYVYPKYMLGHGYKDKSGTLTHFTQPNGSFTQLVQTRLDEYTDMLPWRKSADSYWTMHDVTSLEKREGVYPKYYTYPPVDGVQVDKPVSYAERIKMRAILQQHFGLGVKEAHPVVSSHSSPLFQNVAQRAIVPQGRVQLEKYRHFVIVAELKEHAFGDSYSMELTYSCDGTDEFYAHVAVLTRPLTTSCAGCLGRQAVGNTVKGMIHVPSKHIAQMLDRRNRAPSASEAEEADFCKKRFKGLLVGRTGQIYAHTVTHVGDGFAPEGSRLDPAITPKVTFVSAYACTGGQADAPVELFGFKNFAEVFTGANWQIGPP